MSRRRFLGHARTVTASAAVSALAPDTVSLFGQAPAVVVSDRERVSVPHGVASGDVTARRAMVWSRAERPARLIVEWDTTPAFANARRVEGSAALPETGLTARVALEDLPPAQRIHYRVRFQDLRDLGRWSEPSTGSFVSAPADRRSISLAWSADCVGQGWGINEAWGGLRIFESMRRAQPDLFLHLGDAIYADQPLEPEVKLDDGTIWRNVVTPAKAKVAETLDDFRGNYLYNLIDEHARRFNAAVSQIAIWDDHEVLNNWFTALRNDADRRYTEKSVALLAARAGRAFLEHVPIRFDGPDPERLYRVCHWGPLLDVFVLDLRSYRAPNSANRQAAEGDATRVLGARQRAWLEDALRRSTATWKVMMCSVPIGLVVTDFPDTSTFEAFANGDPGGPLGRELEIAHLLAFLHEHRIHNLVWVTADVHYCAAHHYDPRRARVSPFDPFWEFVAGPMHAGTFGPNRLDATFGPEVRFIGIPEGMKPNRSPAEGFQFFGTLRIDGASEVMTVRLHDLAGTTLWSVDLEPER
jgi:alkaline phosphatase D